MPMSPEARARLAARNREVRQWELAYNSGPKTPEGRKRSGQNALKHGARGKGMAALAGWLSSIRQLLM